MSRSRSTRKEGGHTGVRGEELGIFFSGFRCKRKFIVTGSSPRCYSLVFLPAVSAAGVTVRAGSVRVLFLADPPPCPLQYLRTRTQYSLLGKPAVPILARISTTLTPDLVSALVPRRWAAIGIGRSLVIAPGISGITGPGSYLYCPHCLILRKDRLARTRTLITACQA
eukprot:2010452-Rhodomonas_salina.1